jgi:hypothetical protein
MPNIRIIASNEADAAALSSADFLAALPASNLQLQGRARVARTEDAAGAKVIDGEWPSARVISACVLHGHNLTSAATWRLQGWAGAGQSGDLVLDSGAVPALRRIPWGYFRFGLVPWGATVFSGWERAYSVMWLAPVAVRSWRLTLLDEDNADGYLQAKRLLLGTYFSPEINVEYGLELDWDEATTQERTQAGTLHSDPGAQYRRLQGYFPHLSDVERSQLMELARRVGKRGEVFISVFPEAGSALERDYALLGKFTQLPAGEHGDWASWSKQFTFEEG